MTSINEKLGLKRAGKRAMMKLPKTLSERAALTRAQCPACAQRGVMEFTAHGIVKRLCTWCSHTWEPSKEG